MIADPNANTEPTQDDNDNNSTPSVHEEPDDHERFRQSFLIQRNRQEFELVLIITLTSLLYMAIWQMNFPLMFIFTTAYLVIGIHGLM